MGFERPALLDEAGMESSGPVSSSVIGVAAPAAADARIRLEILAV